MNWNVNFDDVQRSKKLDLKTIIVNNCIDLNIGWADNFKAQCTGTKRRFD